MEIKVISKRKVPSKRANEILGKFIVQRKSNEENRLFLTGSSTPTEDFFQIVSNTLDKFQKHLNESLNPTTIIENNNTDDNNNNTENKDTDMMNGIDSSDENIIPLVDVVESSSSLKDSSNTIQIDDGDVSERYSDSSTPKNNKLKLIPNKNIKSTKDIDSSSNSTESESEKSVQKSKKSTKSPKKSSKKQESSSEESSSESESEEETKKKKKSTKKSSSSKKRKVESSSESSDSSSDSSSSSESSSSEEEKKKKKKKK